jgi:hypothetical protein
MSPKANPLYVILPILALLVIGAVVGVSLLGNFVVNPSAVVAPSATSGGVVTRIEGGRVEFVVGYGKSVTNLSSLAVFDDAGNLLWEFEGHAQGRPEVIEYGVLPVGAPGEYVETFPATGAKPVDIRGTDVVVKGNVRYIIPFGAGHELFEGEFSIPNGTP